MSLLGALGGMGEQMVSIADQNRKQANSEDLLRLQNQLAIDKDKAIADYAQTIKQRDRDRISGIMQGVNNSADTTIDGPVNDRMRSKAMLSALINKGEFEAASQYDKLSDNDSKNVPYGSAMVDKYGNVIYDNASDIKANNDAMRAQAKANGNKKQLTQMDLDRITTQSSQIAAQSLSGSRNPFPTMNDDPKKPGDMAKINLASNLLGNIAVSAAQRGDTVNPKDVMTQIMPTVNKYDQFVTNRARQLANELFDEKGRPKDLQSLQSAGYPADAIQDKNSFMRAYRDQHLSNYQEFDQFRRQNQTNDNQQTPKNGGKVDTVPNPMKSKSQSVENIDNGDAGIGMATGILDSKRGTQLVDLNEEDRLLTQKYEEQTKEISAGTRKNYDADLLSAMKENSRKRRAMQNQQMAFADENMKQQELEKALKQSRVR